MTGTEDATRERVPTAHSSMLIFGLRDDRMWHVTDVPNGKACGCVCPACNEVLIARNNGSKRAAHFSHASGADCASGYETALHRAGKESLLRLMQVVLPAHQSRVRAKALDGRVFEEVVELAAVLVAAASAREEVWQEGFRPDVIFALNGQELFIEIKVSHAVDESKLAKIRAKDVSAIEIDLSHLEPMVLCDQAAFDATLVSNLSLRKWLHSPEIVALESEARARLKAQVAAYEPTAQTLFAAQQAKLKREAAERRLRAEAQREQQERVAAWRQAERERLAPQLQQLALSQDMARMADRERQLALREPVPSLERYRACGCADLFQRMSGHWVFKATFEQWQAHVLDQFFPTDTAQRTMVPSPAIEHAVESKFGVVAFVRELREVAIRTRGILTDVERHALPRPGAVIAEYLEHLCLLGVIKRNRPRVKAVELGTAFEPMGRTVEDALAAHGRALEAARVEQARRTEEAQARDSDLTSNLRQRPTPPMEPEVAARVLAIRASELAVFEHHWGTGWRCNNCFLVAPADGPECPYCGSKGAPLQVHIDQQRLDMARLILPGSPGVAGSLRAAQTVDLSSLQPQMGQLAAEGLVSDAHHTPTQPTPRNGD